MIVQTCRGCNKAIPVSNLKGALYCDAFAQLANVPITEDCFKGGNKYGNVWVEYDNRRFQSGAERDRYIQLKLMERAGEISQLKCQPRYLLREKYRDPQTKKMRRAAYYVADFEYLKDGVIYVEDVKGKVTALCQLKIKLFRGIERYQEYHFELIRAA